MSKILKIFIIVMVLLALGFSTYLFYLKSLSVKPQNNFASTSYSLKKFQSDQEFKDYVAKGKSNNYSFGSRTMAGSNLGSSKLAMDSGPTTSSISVPEMNTGSGGGSVPDRQSSTNVQVVGIDEPDILKTDGKNIFYSKENNYNNWNSIRVVPNFSSMPIHTPSSSMPPIAPSGGTEIIKAFPVGDLSKLTKIAENGELLLSGNNLVVFSSNKIFGYNVSDPKSPEKKWEYEFTNNSRKVDARLLNGQIYLISQTDFSGDKLCPMQTFTSGMSVRCNDIYYPADQIESNSTFSASIISPSDGKVVKNISFLGANGNSTIYMSQNNLYVASYIPANQFEVMVGFLKESKFLPQEKMDKLNKVITYDISVEAKSVEMQSLIYGYLNSLSSAEQESKYKEMDTKSQEYFKKHSREIGKTGLTKLNVKDLEILSISSVPGKVLNNYSLDEYKENLRIAVTVGGDWQFGGAETSANDVYVLDKNLKEVGSVKDLGLKEKIYSARFMGDRGYLVTFRQTDPFYVLDLSNASKPVVKGELKIPGFSSYLHEVADHRILGIGREDGKVKLSLFDVTDAQNPQEISKIFLDSYWSEAQDNPHAFLHDAKYNVFFMPADRGGYIISYENNTLKQVKKVGDYGVKRAVYLNDNLYVLDENGVSVYDEKTWEKIKDLSFN